MNKRAPAIACCISASLLGGAAYAEEITWLSADFPPLAMFDKDTKDPGYMNTLLKQVQQALPQHRIQEEVLPWPRVLFLAQNGGAYCSAMAAQTPEREAYLRFTAPYGYVYPVGVVAMAKNRSLFKRFLNKSGEIRLRDLLDYNELRVGVAGNRAYGAKIDDMLKPLLQSNAAQVMRVSQDNSTKSLIGMLQKSRFDYTMAYPNEAVFYDNALNDLHFYPIAENTALIAGRFSCTKGPHTDQTFADLSRLTSTLQTDTALAASYERWLPPYLIKPYRQRLASQINSSTR
ncbi:TIGR02285 family protein [Rhodoferax sp.]|uniref:TIGR02285 family protein n=1 Tax=Rhodoferax sp. TaxID=50421 RepID=UPI0025FA41B9|nr:TIGR02285 family protein [Rhodoferax sp.]